MDRQCQLAFACTEGTCRRSLERRLETETNFSRYYSALCAKEAAAATRRPPTRLLFAVRSKSVPTVALKIRNGGWGREVPVLGLKLPGHELMCPPLGHGSDSISGWGAGWAWPHSDRLSDPWTRSGPQTLFLICKIRGWIRPGRFCPALRLCTPPLFAVTFTFRGEGSRLFLFI